MMLVRSAPYPAICPLLRRLVAQARHLDEGPIGRQCCNHSTGFNVLQEIVLVLFYRLIQVNYLDTYRFPEIRPLEEGLQLDLIRQGGNDMPTSALRAPGEAIARNREICSRHVWTAPLVKGFVEALANVSGAVMSPAC